MREPRGHGAIRVVLGFLWFTAAHAQTTGAQLATFHSMVDDSDQPYALYVPPSFTPSKKWPLVIALHEEDSNHRFILQRVFGVPVRSGMSDSENLRNFPAVPDYGFLVAAPFARGSMGYRGIAERDVYDVLADVEQRFPVDADRVYLTGISIGGAGALWLALTRPDVWAAVAVVCPASVPDGDAAAGNAANLPLRVYHGALDPIVPVDNSRTWHRRLVDAGAPVSYIEYPAGRHNVWDQAYKNGELFEWFAQHRRSDPERVRLTTKSYRYGSAYWLRIDRMTPGVAASIDATRTSKGELQVSTQNLDAFSLLRTAVRVVIDGTVVPVKSTPVSFVKSGGQWRTGRWDGAEKRRALEGPIADAVGGRQIYVYGTLGAQADVEARRKGAETAARWSTMRQKVSFAPPVKADTAVTAADLEEADLVLFGTPETNSVLARFGPRLPLELSSAAADYGLLFIAPLGKHYALVSSGLPWWTGAEEAHRGGDPQAPPMYRLLTSFGDYVLFKGSLSNVVAEGRFDRNWHVPADAAAKMIVSGTVRVR